MSRRNDQMEDDEFDHDDPQSADMDPDDEMDDLDEAQCPSCGQMMAADAACCPRCGEWVTAVQPGERSLRRLIWPAIVLLVAAALSYVWVLR